MDINLKEKKEIEFWKNSPTEGPGNFTIQNITNKLAQARILLTKIKLYNKQISSSETILEIGAGQGWASCILKIIFPNKIIYTSDISKYAIKSVDHWENLFGVKIDKKIVCQSYKIPLPDESVDLVFCFQSAHHFVKHQETLSELYRILKKKGKAIYLHEPSCRAYIYPIAFKRVNAKRTTVPEDILIYKNIEQMAYQTGFKDVKLVFDPSLINRGPLEAIYYYLLKKIRVLQSILPTAIDYLFVK